MQHTNLNTIPLFFLPGDLTVFLNLHWWSQFFPGAISSVLTRASAGVGGLTFPAALQTTTAWLSRAFT